MCDSTSSQTTNPVGIQLEMSDNPVLTLQNPGVNLDNPIVNLDNPIVNLLDVSNA